MTDEYTVNLFKKVLNQIDKPKKCGKCGTTAVWVFVNGGMHWVHVVPVDDCDNYVVEFEDD